METLLEDEPVITPNPPDSPDADPSRTGALWVGATGVVMLLAAAAVLTAVRWDDIGQTAKLGGLVAITLLMLFGGKRFESVIPLTARAIFHLGALLIPFDVAAVAILADQSWQQTLLVTSWSGVASWYAIQQLDSSVVLRWAARCSVIFAAAGLAAVSPVSAPLALGVAAVAAVALDRQRAALLWTVVAGVLPLAAVIDWPVRIAGAVGDLGFVETDRWQLMAAGLTAVAAALGLTWREPRVERGWLAVVVAAVTALVGVEMFDGSWTSYLVAGVVFLLVQAGGLALRSDEEWKPLLDVFMPLAELLAGLVMAVMFVDAVVVALDGAHADALGLVGAAVLFALGWLTADRRRLLEPTDWLVGLVLGADWGPATVLVPASVLIAAIAAFGSAFAVTGVLLIGGAWAVLTARTGGQWLAAGGAAIAVLISTADWTGVAVTVSAAALMTLAARMQLRRRNTDISILLAAAGGCFWVATSVPLGAIFDEHVALPIIAAGAWLLSLAVTTRVDLPAAHVGRVISLLTLLGVWTVNPWAGLASCAVVLAATALDWWRTGWTPFAGAGGLVIGVAVVPVGVMAGFSMAEVGVLMTVAGVVFVGLLIVLAQQFELPVGVAALTVTTIGLAQAAQASYTLAPALILTGVALLLFGASNRAEAVIGFGAVTLICGIWLQLANWQVDWLEAYLALPALVVLWAGREYRASNGASTWICYAPTIAIFGGLALADRFTGGSAWHAVIAGAVGVLAVIAGGAWRLVGPLVTGTVMLAFVVGYESLGPAALVPTWVWLAIGGSALLGSAVAMERSESTPLEQGQRIAHVLATRYS